MADHDSTSQMYRVVAPTQLKTLGLTCTRWDVSPAAWASGKRFQGFETEQGSASLNLSSVNRRHQSPVPPQHHSCPCTLTPPVTHPPMEATTPHSIPPRCQVFTLWSSSHCCRSSSVSNEIPSLPSSRRPTGEHVAGESTQPQLLSSGHK